MFPGNDPPDDIASDDKQPDDVGQPCQILICDVDIAVFEGHSDDYVVHDEEVH